MDPFQLIRRTTAATTFHLACARGCNRAPPTAQTPHTPPAIDHLAMITVQHPKWGLFDCKPLQFIWSKFPEHYGPHNTIM